MTKTKIKKRNFTTKPIIGATVGLLFLCGESSAAPFSGISYDTAGSTYTEDFDSGLPADVGNFAWSDDDVFAGWYAYQLGTSGAPTEYRKTNGISSQAQVFQWRESSSAGDGAFGTKPNDTTGSIITGIRIANNTGITLSEIAIGYTGEQWYESSEVQNNQLVVSYQVGNPDNLSDGAWTEISALEFNSPQNTGAGTKINGNDAANRQVFSPTTVALTGWDSGTELWIRWYDTNSSGVDQGLAIDDFSFTAVPEPEQFAGLLGLGSLAIAFLRRPRRSNKQLS